MYTIYKVYETTYEEYLKHSIVGRFFTLTEWQPKPASIEVVLSNHPDVGKKRLEN